MNETGLMSIAHYSTGWKACHSVIGFFILCANSVLLYVIARTKNLHRREFIIPTCIAIADLLFGFSFFYGSIRQIVVYSAGWARNVVDSWYCMQQPDSATSFMGMQWGSMMLLMMSIDRFLAMSVPVKYKVSGRLYAQFMCAFSFLWCLCSIGVAFASSYFTENSVNQSMLCDSGQNVPMAYNIFASFEIFGFSLLSVAVYSVALCFMRRRARETGNIAQRHFVQRQVKVTKMLLLVMSFSIFFIVTPMFIIFVALAVQYPPGSGTLAQCLTTMTAMNSVCNVVIYAYKNKDVQTAFFELVGRKDNKVQVISNQASSRRF